MSSDTLLAVLQKFRLLDDLDKHSHHPFGSSFEQSFSLLRDLVSASNVLSHSLAVHASTPAYNSKLVSILRQHGAILQSAHIAEQTISQGIGLLQNRARSPPLSWGEDLPPDRTLLVDWCLSRLQAWGKSVGMEAFRDEVRPLVVLGGKVIVVDVEFVVDSTVSSLPRIDSVNVKTSYAVQNDIPSADNLYSVETLLADCIRAFCNEVQRDQHQQQPIEAARLAKWVVGHLSYLKTLDSFAQRKENGGIHWFTDVHQIGAITEKFAKAEAQSIASSLSIPLAPLDIYLMRSHALPLPYLISPSISFLVHISTQTYLSLLRTSSPPSPSLDHLIPIDVPISRLRRHLSVHPRLPGSTVATLTLFPVSDPQIFTSSLSMHTFSTRPSFFLTSVDSDADYTFLQVLDTATSLMNTAENVKPHIWFLDFTNGGKTLGVVMSQTRMRDIELVVNPFSAMNQFDSVGMMAFNMGSWVDLLLSLITSATAETYTSVYRSSTSLHPPLQLRLMAPQEPGFILERVPVRNMKDVWGTLEVVREQCWLNEVLTSCEWVPENSTANNTNVEAVTEEELQSILEGTAIPERIPVNIYLPSHSMSTESLFDPASLDSMGMQNRRPKIIMTSPERPPISGMIEIAVGLDETRPRGIAVDVRGAPGVELKLDVLEEVSRRGGVLGLPGRIWAGSHGPT